MSFHFHKWSKWSDPINTYGTRKQQWRVCEHCNKAQHKTLWYDHQACLTAILIAIKSIQKATP